MENNYHINPTGDTLTILEGTALELLPPNQISLRGNINAVSSFLKIRHEGEDGDGKQRVDSSRAVVEVDPAAMTIKLSLDPEDYYGATVTASLLMSDELRAFGINTNSRYTQNDLTKLLRFNRLRFFDQAAYEAVLKAVMTFSFNAEIGSANAADTRGNKSAAFDKKVHSNIPADFILIVPIFKGQPALKFRVEICIDTTEGSARFWFESVELAELIEIERERIFENELKSCEGFVIIRK